MRFTYIELVRNIYILGQPGSFSVVEIVLHKIIPQKTPNSIVVDVYED
jgi:hypothetical protein